MIRDDEEPPGVLTIHGPPGRRIPTATVLTTSRGEEVITEHAVRIGPNGTAQVRMRFKHGRVVTKDATRETRVFWTRYDLIASEADWWS